MRFARLARGEVRALVLKAFRRQSTRVYGARLEYILPNIVSPLVVLATTISVKSLLEFLVLGPGVQLPGASARFLVGGRDYLMTAWWIALFLA